MAAEYGKDVVNIAGKYDELSTPIVYSAGMSAESDIHENDALLLCEDFILQKTLCNVMHSASAATVCFQFPFVKNVELQLFTPVMPHFTIRNFLKIVTPCPFNIQVDLCGTSVTRFRNQLQFCCSHFFTRAGDTCCQLCVTLSVLQYESLYFRIR